MIEHLHSPSMIRFTEAPPPSAGVGVAPLVDIVLLLICFYLFVAKSVADLDDASISLPVIVSELANDERPGELVVNLRSDGSILVAGLERSLDELRLLAGEASIAASDAGAIPAVVLRVDRNQTFGSLDRVQRACRESGIAMVLLRTVDRE